MTESPSDTAAGRIAFLRNLRAVRQLRPDPLPEPVLNDILEVARWSGRAGNRQPWEFVVCGGGARTLRPEAVGCASVFSPAIRLSARTDERPSRRCVPCTMPR